MIEPGKLRHRAWLQSPTPINTDGEVIDTWTTEATRRVHYQPLTGRERWFSGQAVSSVTGRVIMRYYAGMRATWRIVLLDKDGNPERTLHIDSIRDPDEKKHSLEIMVIEVDGAGSTP